MTIHAHPIFADKWAAVDVETYDGRECPMGLGPTRNEAIADLMRQIERQNNENTVVKS